jgi:hypothetical protein
LLGADQLQRRDPESQVPARILHLMKLESVGLSVLLFSVMICMILRRLTRKGYAFTLP